MKSHLPSEHALFAFTVFQEETDTVLGMTRRVQAFDFDVSCSNVERLLVLDDSVRTGGKGPRVRFNARAVRVVFELSRWRVSSGILLSTI